MLEPSRHERNGHPSVVSRHFLMPSLANFKAGAGHGFSDEIGETSINFDSDRSSIKATPNPRTRLCRIAHIKRSAERVSTHRAHLRLRGIDTLTTITCQCRWPAHSRSQQNQTLAIVVANPRRLRERLYWINVSMPYFSFTPSMRMARRLFASVSDGPRCSRFLRVSSRT
jgi:hypothetical protein